MTWFTPEVVDVIVSVLKAVVILLAVVVCGALLSWVERRLLALWQDRYGPNRVGPFGVLQPLADAVKILLKEGIIPSHVDKGLFLLAPAISMFTAIFAFAVVPFGPTEGTPSWLRLPRLQAAG